MANNVFFILKSRNSNEMILTRVNWALRSARSELQITGSKSLFPNETFFVSFIAANELLGGRNNFSFSPLLHFHIAKSSFGPNFEFTYKLIILITTSIEQRNGLGAKIVDTSIASLEIQFTRAEYKCYDKSEC